MGETKQAPTSGGLVFFPCAQRSGVGGVGDPGHAPLPRGSFLPLQPSTPGRGISNGPRKSLIAFRSAIVAPSESPPSHGCTVLERRTCRKESEEGVGTERGSRSGAGHSLFGPDALDPLDPPSLRLPHFLVTLPPSDHDTPTRRETPSRVDERRGRNATSGGTWTRFRRKGKEGELLEEEMAAKRPSDVAPNVDPTRFFPRKEKRAAAPWYVRASMIVFLRPRKRDPARAGAAPKRHHSLVRFSRPTIRPRASLLFRESNPV